MSEIEVSLIINDTPQAISKAKQKVERERWQATKLEAEKVIATLTMAEVQSLLVASYMLSVEEYDNNCSDLIGVRVAEWSKKLTDYRNHLRSIFNGPEV